MIKIDKTFIAGKMNKDTDERLIPEGEYLDALNVTVDTSRGATIGAVQNSPGNEVISNINSLTGIIATNAVTIGSISYEPDNLIYWLVICDEYDAIFEYNQITGITQKVLLSTTGQLNFNRSHIVTGIDYIPGIAGDGPFLYWTDNFNPPRRINVTRAKSYSNDDSRIDLDIDVILAPPLYSPKIRLYSDNSIDTSNNIEDKFIYFSYRYKYNDNQYSAMSPFSAVAFHANSFSYDYLTGDNKGMVNKFNKVEVTFDTGNQFVQEIQVLYFDTYKLNVYIIDNYNKDELLIPDEFKYSIQFSANKIYTPIDNSEVTKLFDNVPLLARAQDIVGNRLIYGNYTQFRDIVDSDNNKIVPDYSLSLEATGVPLGLFGMKTFRSDRDYEIGVIYTDEYGRASSVLTSKDNELYIPPDNSNTANSIKLELSNKPPFWATNYRFAIKQAQGEYYNIFPRLTVPDGEFRYFLINESDRDKITIGGYIVFKTVANIPTNYNKQFKVLELEYKDANAPFTIEGLYFKIKASDGDAFLNNSNFNVNKFESIGRGPRTQNSICCVDDPDTPNVLINKFSYVNRTPIYYSISGNTTLPLPSPAVYATPYVGNESQSDRRIAIKIVSPTEFQYTDDVGLTGWSSSITIPSSPYILTILDTTLTLNFDTDGTNPNLQYTIGDIFIFNVRGYNPTGFTGTPFNPTNSYGLWHNDVLDINPVLGVIDYGGHAAVNTYGPIYPGATIRIEIVEDGQPGSGDRNALTILTSTAYYQNLEEWFWHSGAYLAFSQWSDVTGGTNINSETVIFREAIDYTNQTLNPSCSPNFTTNVMEQKDVSTARLYMLIRGFGEVGPSVNSLSCVRNQIKLKLSITQQYDNPPLSIETVPLNSDVDIFYEMRKTYAIKNGFHTTSWRYADYTSAVGTFVGKTVLGPVNPSSPSPTDLLHWFNVGERIWVQNSSIVDGPTSGYYDILAVDEYSITIDLNFPGAGPVTPGNVFYKTWERDQSSTSNLIVELNNVTSDNSDFNAFAFGNGVESSRIYDNFLRPTMKYSPRASSVIEDYEQQKKYASLCYSGIYKGDTSTNRLNSFNLSQANFKNLDIAYGAVEKIYARDTDLLVLHQDKITKVLYGKNLLVDAVGGGQVASVPEVLGTQIAHPSEYGISNNPESFAKHANTLFFSDARRGAVLQMTGDDVVEISAMGMRDYFRGIMAENPNSKKLGCFDPFNDTYVIAFDNQVCPTCCFEISFELEGQQVIASLNKVGPNKYASDDNVYQMYIVNEKWTIYQNGSDFADVDVNGNCPPLSGWNTLVSEFEISECTPCPECYNITLTIDDITQTIQLNKVGPNQYSAEDEPYEMFISDGKWVITFQGSEFAEVNVNGNCVPLLGWSALVDDFDIEACGGSCECIKVTYQLVGEEPVTVEVEKDRSGSFLPFYISPATGVWIEFIDNEWIVSTGLPSPTTLQATLSEDTPCPFGTYTIEEGSIFESFIVEPCDSEPAPCDCGCTPDDSTNKTITYSVTSQGWNSFWSYEPDWMIELNNTFYTFKGGNVWRHNTNVVRNNFYGTQYNSKIKTIFNNSPIENKMFKAISISSTKPWMTNMQTNINDGSIDYKYFVEKEGIWFAYIRRFDDTIDVRALSTQGIGIPSNIAVVSGSIVNTTFNFKLDSSISVGDKVYKNSSGSLVLIGTITALTPTVITIDTGLGMMPITTDFLICVKNSQVESYGVRGVYMIVELESDSTDELELFSISSTIFKSFQ